MEVFPESSRLKVLRRLVVALLVVMIAGIVVMTTVITIRALRLESPPVFPDSIAIPEGHAITAVTRGTDWIAVVTNQDRILVFDPTGQELRQSIEIEPRSTVP